MLPGVRRQRLHGGSGYAKALPVERIWREVRVVRILAAPATLRPRPEAHLAMVVG